jgi:metallo-beta-lactamase class B
VSLRAILFPILLLCGVAGAAPQNAQDGDGNKPYPPFRIMANIYYVGADDIASYLIVTPAGDFLLNNGFESTAPLIRDSIQKLGFHLSDVKILLNGQAHFDHVAGQASMQKWTGAKIYSSARDAGVLESGGKTDPRWGKEVTYAPVKVDHIVEDGEKVTLGGVTLVAHITPGHTMGCTTWTMTVEDGGRRYEVVFVGGTSINPGVRLVDRPSYPGIAEDYAKTFRVLRGLKCDVFLGAHGGYYGMPAKRERQKQHPDVNPFIDPEGYRQFVDSSEKTYLEQLRRERGKL